MCQFIYICVNRDILVKSEHISFYYNIFHTRIYVIFNFFQMLQLILRKVFLAVYIVPVVHLITIFRSTVVMNSWSVIKRLLDLAVQTPNPRSKTPRLISSCRDGGVTSRAWRVIKSQRSGEIHRSGPYVVDWSHMINRDLARCSYLTVFPRHTFRNIPTCRCNEYQTLALYSTSVIC